MERMISKFGLTTRHYGKLLADVILVEQRLGHVPYVIENAEWRVVKLKINPLIAIPSARDLKPFAEATAKLTKYHKLWAKYYFEQEAYQEIRKWFLEHTEYTHLVLLADDLIIQQEHLDKLVSELEKHDYDVLTGVAMVNREAAFDNQLTISTARLPPRERNGRVYELMHISEYELFPDPKPIIKIVYQGFPLPFISRRVVEKVPFRDDRYFNPFMKDGVKQYLEHACCVDLMFCNDCIEAGFEMYSDLSVFTDHMGGMNTRSETLAAGIKTAYLALDKNNSIV